MTTTELAKAISLDPRAVVIEGTLRERTKNSNAGQISGYAPHYTMTGCPLVTYDASGTIIPTQAEASAIEANFTEVPRPELSPILVSYGRPLNMVHLAFGRQGVAPNPVEARVINEAGTIFKATDNQPAFLAALPILSTGQYGVATGRLYPLGVFNKQGEPVWIHPGAVGLLLQSPFPARQLQRSLQVVVPPPAPAPAPAPAPTINWYPVMSASLGKSTGFTGQKLHHLVLGSYADQLLIQGKASERSAALEIAKTEYAAWKATSAEPKAEPKAETKAPAAPKPAAPIATKSAAAPALPKPAQKGAGAGGVRRA